MSEGTARVGFVGIGKMGYPMAACLRRAGVEVMAFDVAVSAAERFVAEHGGRVAGSLAETARESDAVITMVPDGKIVHRIVFGEGDCLSAGLRADQIFIDMSSSAPADTERLHAGLLALGISAVDAPVSGGVKRAKTGTLTIMAGGESDAVERAKPILSHLGSVVHAGKPGAGQAAKALNNLLSATGLVAAVEVMLVAKRYGLDLETFLGILNSSTGRNNSTENKIVQFVLNRDFGSGFALDLMAKDVANAVDLAQQTGTVAFLSPLCREICASAARELGTGADHTEIARWLEARTGGTLAGDEETR